MCRRSDALAMERGGNARAVAPSDTFLIANKSLKNE
jgi:hypothetical protein